MSGLHNMSMYTTDDNPWCSKCQNGELIVGDFMLKTGVYLCWTCAIPLKEKCEGFKEKKP